MATVIVAVRVVSHKNLKKKLKKHLYGRLLLKNDGRVTSEIQVWVPHVQLPYGRLDKTQHSYHLSRHIKSNVQWNVHVQNWWMSQCHNEQLLWMEVIRYLSNCKNLSKLLRQNVTCEKQHRVISAAWTRLLGKLCIKSKHKLLVKLIMKFQIYKFLVDKLRA